MPVTLDLSEATLARLQAEAERRGTSLEALIEEMAGQLAANTEVKRNLSFVGVTASSSRRSARDADEMLAEGFGHD